MQRLPLQAGHAHTCTVMSFYIQSVVMTKHQGWFVGQCFAQRYFDMSAMFLLLYSCEQSSNYVQS